MCYSDLEGIGKVSQNWSRLLVHPKLNNTCDKHWAIQITELLNHSWEAHNWLNKRNRMLISLLIVRILGNQAELEVVYCGKDHDMNDLVMGITGRAGFRALTSLLDCMFCWVVNGQPEICSNVQLLFPDCGEGGQNILEGTQGSRRGLWRQAWPCPSQKRWDSLLLIDASGFKASDLFAIAPLPAAMDSWACCRGYRMLARPLGHFIASCGPQNASNVPCSCMLQRGSIMEGKL